MSDYVDGPPGTFHICDKPIEIVLFCEAETRRCIPVEPGHIRGKDVRT